MTLIERLSVRFRLLATALHHQDAVVAAEELPGQGQACRARTDDTKVGRELTPVRVRMKGFDHASRLLNQTRHNASRMEQARPSGPSEDDPDMYALVDACAWPSEAFWRSFELGAVRRHPFRRPILELGCGNGRFTELAGLEVDDAIDLNPRAVERARRLGHVYGRVRHADIRELEADGSPRFASVFSNSVLEHVPDLDSVLVACHAVLEPGGQLVITVPLEEMNRHLLLHRSWYASWRAAKLEHRNLWTVPGWTAALQRAGFGEVSSRPYFDGSACRSWDRLDFPGSLGFGRIRLGVGLRRAASIALPDSAKPRLKRRLARRLRRRAAAVAGGPPCATLLVATKPSA
jgi:SAM-dependent methyltransferase